MPPATDTGPYSSLAAGVLDALGHAPTGGQRLAATAIARLLASARAQAVLVLKGYAGTGKTSLVAALVKLLAQQRQPTVLLAPTGRAAKVLGAYAQAVAGTIHRRIYRWDEEAGPQVTDHDEEGTLFIVDEAGMIGRSGGDGSFFGRDLLADLMRHAFSAPACKVLLIGDPAQLPPVGSAESPALDVRHLRAMGLAAGQVELTEVVRQAATSGILHHATVLRDLITAAQAPPGPRPAAAHVPRGSPAMHPRFTPLPDVVRIDGHDLQEALETAYAQDGDDGVCIITRSNKRAYRYNREVRLRIHGFEEELCAGDRLMVVRNDLLWAGLNGTPGLIANGETIAVKRVHRTEEVHGLRFADLTAAWTTPAGERELEVKVMLDTLAAESAALPRPRLHALADAVLRSSGGGRRSVLRTDPHLNALQVKYAHAFTGHKAQGGQWRTVFVEQGHLTEAMVDAGWLRWLYTAVTRATHRLFLVGFHPRFWEDEG